MYTTIFYAFACLLFGYTLYELLTRQHKKQPDLNPRNLDEHRASLKTTKTITFILSAAAIAWKIAGLWMPEKTWFIILLVTSFIAMVLSFMAKTKEARSGVAIISSLTDAFCIGYIIYLHYGPIYLD